MNSNQFNVNLSGDSTLYAFHQFLQLSIPTLLLNIQFYSLGSKFLVLGEETSTANPHLGVLPFWDTGWHFLTGWWSHVTSPGGWAVRVRQSPLSPSIWLLETRCCRWSGRRTAESFMNNDGLGGVPGPAADFACPRNTILSYSVTQVLELLIAAAETSPGNLLEKQPWAPPSPTRSDTLERGARPEPGCEAGWHLRTPALAHRGECGSQLQTPSWQSVGPLSES